MEVKTQSCVVAGKRAVAVTEQNIEWNNKRNTRTNYPWWNLWV